MRPCSWLLTLSLGLLPLLTPLLPLPAQAQSSRPTPLDRDRLTVKIPKGLDGAVIFQNKRLSYDQLREELTKLYNKNPNGQIVIDADKDVEYKVVVKVMDLIISGVGFRRISILTSPSASAHRQKAPAARTAPGNKPPSPRTHRSPSQRLQAIFRAFWRFTLRQSPLFATRIGEKAYDAMLPDASLAAQHRDAQSRRRFLQQLKALPHQKLSRREHINSLVLQQFLRMDLAEYRFKAYLIPITNREGFHISFAQFAQRHRLRTAQDAQHYITRLRRFRAYARQNIALMRLGLAKGYTLAQVVLRGYEGTIKPHTTTDPNKSLFFKPLRTLPKTLPANTRASLQTTAKLAIKTSVAPAYQELLTFMQKEYIPKARKTLGASALPKGAAFYTHRVYRYTTLPLTPKQVHEQGLREVKRIRKEMQAIIKQVKFKGNFAAFLHFLRTDPKFYARTPKELLRYTSYVLKRMDGQLPRLFRRLPRIPYGIKPIPAYIAPKTTTAYYSPPPGDGSRAGFYYVNTYNLKSRPLYEVQALSFHEAVPGHHLQLALQRELKGQPTFRRFFYFNAYIEGWALYAERLGLEVGFYKDPYANFGRLTYEMWRACRLVVDTGIHAFGWSRKRAVDYMARHTALSLHNIKMEVDRYIAWPGQALGYKIGELKIRALRAQAEKALGTRFDLRTFHDVILRDGSLPLQLLERNVQRYIQKTRRKP